MTDQITNNDEIAAGDNPASANSTAYTRYRRTKGSRNAETSSPARAPPQVKINVVEP